MEKDIDYIVRRLKEIYGDKIEIKYIENETNYEMIFSYKKDEETLIEKGLYITKNIQSNIGRIVCEISKQLCIIFKL